MSFKKFIEAYRRQLLFDVTIIKKMYLSYFSFSTDLNYFVLLIKIEIFRGKFVRIMCLKSTKEVHAGKFKI